MWCSHCQVSGWHDILSCPVVVEEYGLPAQIGVECTICKGKGHHRTHQCPGVPFRPVLSARLRQLPCLFCEKHHGCVHYDHQVPTCDNFASYHELSGPYWCQCGECGIAGDLKYPTSPSLGAYLDGVHGQVIVFHLETTGLHDSAEILEIVALQAKDHTKEDSFQVFVQPEKRIKASASKVNHFTKFNEGLYRDGHKVNAIPFDEALGEFMNWLARFECPILVGHNCRNFHALKLRYNVAHRASCDNRVRFMEKYHRFGDTLPLFREVFPKTRKKLGDVYVKIFDTELDQAHLATVKVGALADIINANVDELKQSNFRRHAFSAMEFEGEGPPRN